MSKKKKKAHAPKSSQWRKQRMIHSRFLNGVHGKHQKQQVKEVHRKKRKTKAESGTVRLVAFKSNRFLMQCREWKKKRKRQQTEKQSKKKKEE